MTGYLTRNVKHEIQSFEKCDDCLKNLAEPPGIVIIAHMLKAGQDDASEEIEILEIIRKNYPATHIIVLAGQEGYGTAMQTILKGAEQYVINDKDAFEKINALLSEI